MNAPRLDLIFFWHMHQPDYRDHANGEFIMPWAYLRGRLSAAGLAAAEAQPSFCESSDWFWWFGDYNPSQAVISFDQIFRRNWPNCIAVCNWHLRRNSSCLSQRAGPMLLRLMQEAPCATPLLPPT